MLFFLYGSKILSKNSGKVRFCFKKKLRYLKYKIPSFTIFFFYFFSIFGILFSISPIQTCPKIIEFFVVCYWKDYRVYQQFLENSKSSFKKTIHVWNFFFQNSAIYYLFIIFYYFWQFIFNFVYLYLSKNSTNFYDFLFYRLEILSKNFGESWNIFQKNIDIRNPKFFINSIVYYLFFFILLSYW